MAHFAKLDKNNKVLSIVVVNNDVITDTNGQEQEQLGIDFLKSLYGQDTNWVQTSYNDNFRKNFAAIGGTYHVGLDAFIPPCDYQGWKFNQELCKWEVPVPYPSDGKQYYWNNIICNWSLNE